MSETPWAEIGQGIGVAITAVLATLGITLGKRKGTGEPPADRAPTPHEVKVALSELRAVVDRRGDDTDELIDDIKDRLIRIERMFERMSDRMDTEARIGNALAKLGRE